MWAERSGERLWLALLAATVVFVAGDFVRYPFIGAQEGRAASSALDVTIVQPLGDATSPLRADARALAGALSHSRYSARAQSSGVGAAATLLAFAKRDEQDGRELLLLTSSALAEAARALRQPATGHEAAEARAALRVLGRLRPVAGVSADATAIAVRPHAPATSLAALAAEMRADPGGRVAGIGADAASKATLASLVSAIGLEGKVPYRVFPTGGEAALALATGDVDLVVAPRSQTLAESRRGSVRTLSTPAAGSTAQAVHDSVGAPVWSILVGPPALSERARRSLSARVDGALRAPAWRRRSARRELRGVRQGPAALSAFVNSERARALRLAAVVATVPEQRRRRP